MFVMNAWIPLRCRPPRIYTPPIAIDMPSDAHLSANVLFSLVMTRSCRVGFPFFSLHVRCVSYLRLNGRNAQFRKKIELLWFMFVIFGIT